VAWRGSLVTDLTKAMQKISSNQGKTNYCPFHDKRYFADSECPSCEDAEDDDL
jgi:hypothetical protein